MALGNVGCGNAKIFLIELLTGRFFAAFATIMTLSFIGSSYIFGLYSNDIKSILGYDQTTLNIISFFKDLGAYMVVHTGLLMEVAPPWVILALGAVVNFVGYFMIWLSVTQRIARPQVWQMCLFIAIGANSIGFANTVGLVTCVHNFPENRGVVMGILKGYIGLGGAIMTQLYHSLYGNDTKAVGVILIIAVAPSIASLLFAFSIRVLETFNRQAKRDKKFFYDILYISLGLAGFIMAMIILQKKVEFTKRQYRGSFAVIAVLLVLPVVLVVREEWASWKANRVGNTSNNLPELKVVPTEDMPDSTNQAVLSEKLSCFHNVFHPPDFGEDYSILQATFSVDMQILFLATICGIGGNLTTIDNLGQIGKSLAYQKKSISTFVSLISIWQYLGRVAGGVASDYLLRKFKWPRPFFLTIVLFLSCIGHLLIAFNTPYGLFVASIIIGFCFGAQWTFLFAVISELFGLKHYATLNTYAPLTAPLGSYIFNARIAGHLYDREGMRQLAASGLTRKPGQELNCSGVKCYQMAYIIIFACTFFSALVSLVLAIRTRKFYKGDIYKKFRGETKELSTN